MLRDLKRPVAHRPGAHSKNVARVAAFTLLLGAGVAFSAEPKEWLERMNKALTTRNYVGVFTHVHGGRVETLRIIHRVRGRRCVRAPAVARWLGPRVHSRRQRTHLLLPRQARRSWSSAARPTVRCSVPCPPSTKTIRWSTKSVVANASACSAATRAWSRCNRATNIATATACGSTKRPRCRSRPSCAISRARSSSRSCSPPSICRSAFPTPCSSRRWTRPPTAGCAPIAR